MTALTIYREVNRWIHVHLFSAAQMTASRYSNGEVRYIKNDSGEIIIYTTILPIRIVETFKNDERIPTQTSFVIWHPRSLDPVYNDIISDCMHVGAALPEALLQYGVAPDSRIVALQNVDGKNPRSWGIYITNRGLYDHVHKRRAGEEDVKGGGLPLIDASHPYLPARTDLTRTIAPPKFAAA